MPSSPRRAAPPHAARRAPRRAYSGLVPPDQHQGAVPRYYTSRVPTKHRRVSVTVTPPLREARERLRRRGVTASVAELALVGAHELLAEAKARDADQQRRQALRKRLASRLRSGDALNPGVLSEVREHGWTRA